MVSKWVITPIYPIYKQVITHLLTIDPNFQRDIPSTFANWEFKESPASKYDYIWAIYGTFYKVAPY